MECQWLRPRVEKKKLPQSRTSFGVSLPIFWWKKSEENQYWHPYNSEKQTHNGFLTSWIHTFPGPSNLKSTLEHMRCPARSDGSNIVQNIVPPDNISLPRMNRRYPEQTTKQLDISKQGCQYVVFCWESSQQAAKHWSTPTMQKKE